MENSRETEQRTNLFSKLNDVITLSHKKVTAERGNSDTAKQAWSRVLISAIATYGNLLKDVELDELAAEVAEIKATLEKKANQ
jgi:hypothetical protein